MKSRRLFRKAAGKFPPSSSASSPAEQEGFAIAVPPSVPEPAPFVKHYQKQEGRI